MRLRARIVALGALGTAVLCTVGFGIAQAQPAPATPGAGDTATGVTKPVNLSIEDMGKQGDAHVARIDMSATTVRRPPPSATVTPVMLRQAFRLARREANRP